jgi:magnesium chelatase accessory protein
MGRLHWDSDGLGWPHRERSRFVTVQGLCWHVQQWPGPTPHAPLALLIHGTGAASHSWRDLAPALNRRFALLTIDLPGHAFTQPVGTQAPPLSLPGMARALAELLAQLQLAPDLVLGHSAGAAIALRMCLSGAIEPRLVLGLNAALLPLGGLAGQLFSPVAKLMALTPWVPHLFARRAQTPAVLDRLLHSTGSVIDAPGRALYQLLVSDPGHVAGALGMMANWDLDSLSQELGQLQTPLDLIVGTRDLTVPPAQAERVLRLLPAALQAQCLRLAGLGHLAHEEQAERVAHLIAARWDERARARLLSSTEDAAPVQAPRAQGF